MVVNMAAAVALLVNITGQDLAALGVDGQSPVTTALVGVVAIAGHTALGVIQLLNLGKLVAAVAFAAILSASDAEALGAAVSNTSGIVDPAEVGADHSAENTVRGVLVAAGILEIANGLAVSGSISRLSSTDSRDVDGRGGLDSGRLDDSGGLGLACDGLLDDIGGAGRRRLDIDGQVVAAAAAAASAGTIVPALDGVVAGKLVQLAVNLLIDRALDLARLALIVDTANQTRAGVYASMASVAVVNDLLKGLFVPAGNEVTVDREASSITVGKDEGALLANKVLVTIDQTVSVPVGLEEDVRSVNPSLGAVVLVITRSSREGHVVLVVIKTGLGVVARREVDIGSHGRGICIAVLEGESPAFAILVGLHASHGTIRALGPAWWVEVGAGAGDGSGSDRSLGRVLVGVLAVASARWGRPQHGITANHLQTQREGLDRIIGRLEAASCQCPSDLYKKRLRSTYK